LSHRNARWFTFGDHAPSLREVDSNPPQPGLYPLAISPIPSGGSRLRCPAREPERAASKAPPAIGQQLDTLDAATAMQLASAFDA